MLQQRSVERDVVLCHSGCRKPLLNCRRTACLFSASTRGSVRTASSMEFTMNPVTPRSITWAPTGAGMREPVCRRPSPRSSRARTAPANRSEQQRSRLAEKLGLGAIADLSHELDARLVKQRRDFLTKIGSSRSPTLAAILRGMPKSLRKPDSPVRPLFRRDAANESNITAAGDDRSGRTDPWECRGGWWRQSWPWQSARVAPPRSTPAACRQNRHRGA